MRGNIKLASKTKEPTVSGPKKDRNVHDNTGTVCNYELCNILCDKNNSDTNKYISVLSSHHLLLARNIP
jgi:hypothetical protein